MRSSGLTGRAAEEDRRRELEAAAEKSGISGSDGIARVGAGGCAVGCDDVEACKGPGLDDMEVAGNGTAVGVESSLLVAASLS